jgi:antitoxin PrlF
MAVTRVTMKGQVTIPRAIRSAMGIKPGDGVMFVLEGDRVVMVPIKRRSLTELRGVFKVDKRMSHEEERRAAQEHVVQHVMGIGHDDAD